MNHDNILSIQQRERSILIEQRFANYIYNILTGNQPDEI